MKVQRKADHALREANCKAATGRTLAEWHAQIDARGGIAPGRRDIGSWIAGAGRITGRRLLRRMAVAAPGARRWSVYRRCWIKRAT